MAFKRIDDFQLLEKELIQERRFGLIAKMCNMILRLQREHKRNLCVELDDKGTKKGLISFNVIEVDRALGMDKKTLGLAVLHLDKDNVPDGYVEHGKVKKWKKG